MTIKYFTRQVGFFDPKYFDHYSATIVGCGAVGSFTALTLAKMGLKKFILIDPDRIEEHNLPNQFTRIDVVGFPKVKCLSDLLHMFANVDHSIRIYKKFDTDMVLTSEIVIAATDNMASRKAVYKVCKESKVRLLIDARMGGETFVVFTVNMFDKKSRQRYEKTFHKDAEIPCTRRAIIYNILFIAGVIANQIKKVMNNEKYALEVNGDLKNLILLKE